MPTMKRKFTTEITPQRREGRSVAQPQPDCAKRLECVELAPAFEPPPALRQRQQAAAPYPHPADASNGRVVLPLLFRRRGLGRGGPSPFSMLRFVATFQRVAAPICGVLAENDDLPPPPPPPPHGGGEGGAA